MMGNVVSPASAKREGDLVTGKSASLHRCAVIQVCHVCAASQMHSTGEVLEASLVEMGKKTK